jgi:hypothetical protein
VKQPVKKRIHIVEGPDWRRSIVALLESRSPYRPWRYGFGEAHKGDPVAIVLHTEPRTVLTTVARIGADDRRDRAVARQGLTGSSLVDLDSLVMLTRFDRGADPRDAWVLYGDDATRFHRALKRAHRRRDKSMRFGHSSPVKARILLRSRGRCNGCSELLDLTGDDATEAFRIHTVDQPLREAPEVLIKEEEYPSYVEQGIPDGCWRPRLPADWPGIVCRRCCARMEAAGYTNLLDFRFAQHPECRKCGGRRVQAVQFGMPVDEHAYRDVSPWVDRRGCGNDGTEWACTHCGYQW